jgi:uncharacterized protein YdhG (YjbR/CyaY superfamily)/GNAT superfamily N-acetyltransferase
MTIHLRKITDANRDAVRALRVRPDQTRFVASVSRSLADAAATPQANPWYRAIYRDDEPVGFVLLSWNVPPDRPGILGRYFLWRLLIDARHQGQGIGRAALTQIADLIRADGGTELRTSYQPGDGEPWPFYQRLGFEPPATSTTARSSFASLSPTNEQSVRFQEAAAPAGSLAWVVSSTTGKGGTTMTNTNKTAAGKTYDGFTAEERGAMKERAKELKSATRRGAKGDQESAVLAKIAEMPEADRAIGERLHAIIKASAPALSPTLWYGQPAYAKNGKVVCFFQSAHKFNTRYATFGFNEEANLDDGTVWPTAFALTKLTAKDEATIGALVKKAAS